MERYEPTELQIQCQKALNEELDLKNVDIEYCKMFKSVEECVEFFRELLAEKDEILKQKIKEAKQKWKNC